MIQRFKMYHWNIVFPMKTSKALLFKLLMVPLVLGMNTANAQTPADAEMMPTGDLCFFLGYDYGSFDEYWEGSKLRTNATIATVERRTVMPMLAVGVFKNANLYVGVPHVSTRSTEPNGGKFAGVNGFQDLGISLKYQALRKKMAGGELMLLGSTGFSTPATNYLADYMPYSLGVGAPEFFLRSIAQYKLNNNLYFRASAAHMWRGYAKTERDYYYSNGSRYSNYMDVPNAWNFEGVIGFRAFDNTLRLEAIYGGQRSTSGDDIRPYYAPKPTNKVNFDRWGLFAQYYFKNIDGLGVLAYHNRVFDGLNTGKINNTGVGVSYQFNFKKNTNVQ